MYINLLLLAPQIIGLLLIIWYGLCLKDNWSYRKSSDSVFPVFIPYYRLLHTKKSTKLSNASIFLLVIIFMYLLIYLFFVKSFQ